MAVSLQRPDFSLEGRLALITGSVQGLGLVIAQAYAASGARVILNGRDPDRVTQAVDTLRQQGADAHGWVADVSALASLETQFASLCASVGTPDILVNNVGMRLRKSLQQASLAEIQQLMQTNLLSCVQLSRLAAEAMVRGVAETGHQAASSMHSPRKGPGLPGGGPATAAGRIITLTSIAGRLARPEDTIYPIAKQGLEGLVRALAVELGPHGITSNGIAPGTFATESNAALATDPVRGPLVVGRNPLGRWARPEEIAGAAVFLASPAASYVNGHILVVDGGFTVAF